MGKASEKRVKAKPAFIVRSVTGQSGGGTVKVVHSQPKGYGSEKRVKAKLALTESTERPGGGQEGPLRATEMTWLMQHPDRLADFEAQWVVVEGSSIVCHGRDLVDVVKEARASGISIPFAIRVPAKQEGPVVV